MGLLKFGVGLFLIAVSVPMLVKIVKVDDPKDWSGYLLLTYAVFLAVGGVLIRWSV